MIRPIAATILFAATMALAQPGPVEEGGNVPVPAAPVPPVPEARESEAATQPFRAPVRVVRPPAQAVRGALQEITNLAFNASVLEKTASLTNPIVHFTFTVTNISDAPAAIESVRTSCGCTVAQLPPMPWTLKPGESGSFDIDMDIRGKRGSLTKSVYVATAGGMKTLYVRSIIPTQPAMNDQRREMNLMLAKADRQAVFKGDCASCHAVPTRGKTGSALYEAACAICHDAAHRADMVPDLRMLQVETDYDYWHHWISNGREDSLMPAFSRKHGGPLSEAQIHSLAHWLSRNYPEETVVAPNPE